MSKLGKFFSVWPMFTPQQLAKLLPSLSCRSMRLDTDNLDALLGVCVCSPSMPWAKPMNNQELPGLHFSERLYFTPACGICIKTFSFDFISVYHFKIPSTQQQVFKPT